MRFTEILWRQQYAEKIIHEHHVELAEGEEVLSRKPFVRLQERGRRHGEDLYVAYRQTAAGRFIVAFIIHKGKGVAMPISARDMTKKEKRYYASRQ
jgi:uncharacterized DUF497 family protein